MSRQTCECCGGTFPSPFIRTLCSDCRRAGCEDLADDDLCAAAPSDTGQQAGLTDF